MTKEREAEIRKHHAPHDPHCNEHCTTRGLLELLDAEREKNAKLERCAKQAPILCDFHRHTTEIEQLRKERHDMECDHPSSDGIAELTIFGEKIYRCGVCKRAHVYVRFGFDYTINLPERLIAALAAQGDKPHD